MRLLIIKFQIIDLLLVKLYLRLCRSYIIFERFIKLPKISMSLNGIKLTKPLRESLMVSIVIKDIVIQITVSY